MEASEISEMRRGGRAGALFLGLVFWLGNIVPALPWAGILAREYRSCSSLDRGSDGASLGRNGNN